MYLRRARLLAGGPRNFKRLARMQHLNHHPINRHYHQLRLNQLRRAFASSTSDRAATTASTAGIAESIDSMIKRYAIYLCFLLESSY